jgi:hypothetical protein
MEYAGSGLLHKSVGAPFDESKISVLGRMNPNQYLKILLIGLPIISAFYAQWK